MEKWEFVFLQLAVWRQHPGYQREGTKVPDLWDLAKEATEIVKIMEHMKCQQ